VNLRIEEGERISIQGSTGGGKSTLLQLLGVLDRPSSGAIRFDGRDLGAMSENDQAKLRAERIGFIFQNYNLIPTLTAAENVECGLVPLDMDRAARRAAVAQVLESVGLADRATHLPVELSGGQQQRVAIARALVKKPSVILADEPTGNLDEDTRDEIAELIEQLAIEHGLTIVTVTHDSVLARRADRHLTIKKGTVTER
jgi:putative ABC transport system ATP-binding protein